MSAEDLRTSIQAHNDPEGFVGLKLDSGGIIQGKRTSSEEWMLSIIDNGESFQAEVTGGQFILIMTDCFSQGTFFDHLAAKNISELKAYLLTTVGVNLR